MSAQQIIFYLISAAVLGFGILSVITTRIFRAAIFLLFSLIAIAGIYFFLEYEFIAAVQIVVYVGGIVVLIIFSIFLTHRGGEEMQEPSKTKELAAYFASFFAFAFIYLLAKKETFYAPSQ